VLSPLTEVAGRPHRPGSRHVPVIGGNDRRYLRHV